MYVLGSDVQTPWEERLTEPEAAAADGEAKEAVEDDAAVSMDTLMLTLMDMQGEAAVKRTDVILARVRADKSLANHRMEVRMHARMHAHTHTHTHTLSHACARPPLLPDGR